MKNISTTLGIFALAIILMSCVGCATTVETQKVQDGFSFDGAVVTDTRTGLMWTRDANIARKSLNWYEAADLVQGVSIGGYHDWRLPTEKELRTLKDYFGYLPYDSLNRMGFANVNGDGEYMSSDTNPYGVLSVSFRFGYTEDAAHMAEGPKHGLQPFVGSLERPKDKSNDLVWPVRGGGR